MRLRKDNSALLSAAQLKTLYASMGIMLRETGSGRLTCLCPFEDHDDSSPSFSVYPDGGYHCYGCSRHGSLEDMLDAFGQDTRYNLARIDLTLASDTVQPYLQLLRQAMEDRLRSVAQRLDAATVCKMYDDFDRFVTNTRFVVFDNRLEAAVTFKRAVRRLAERSGGNHGRTHSRR